MLLSCVVAAAIVTFVGKNNFESNAHESNDLIMANIEALTQSETYFQVREDKPVHTRYTLVMVDKSNCWEEQF